MRSDFGANAYPHGCCETGSNACAPASNPISRLPLHRSPTRHLAVETPSAFSRFAHLPGEMECDEERIQLQLSNLVVTGDSMGDAHVHKERPYSSATRGRVNLVSFPAFGDWTSNFSDAFHISAVQSEPSTFPDVTERRAHVRSLLTRILLIFRVA